MRAFYVRPDGALPFASLKDVGSQRHELLTEMTRALHARDWPAEFP